MVEAKEKEKKGKGEREEARGKKQKARRKKEDEEEGEKQTDCLRISKICEPCCLSLNNGSLIIAGAGVARGYVLAKYV